MNIQIMTHQVSANSCKVGRLLMYINENLYNYFTCRLFDKLLFDVIILLRSSTRMIMLLLLMMMMMMMMMMLQ